MSRTVRRITSRALPLFLFALFAPCLAQTQESARPAVAGKVTEATTGRPVAYARVYLHETQQNTLTDSLGRFRLANVRPGVYHLHFESVLYYAKARTITVGDSTLIVTAELSPRTLETGEVVVEDDFLKTDYLEHAQTVDYVDGAFLNKNSGNNLMETLSRLPGVNYINVGVGIAKPVIRGMSLNRVAVFENGIRQEGQQWGADHGLEIDQFRASRVEIIRGPAAVAYGSEAVGGVVNFKPPPIPQEGELSGEARLVWRHNNRNIGGTAMLETNRNGWVGRARFSFQDYGDYRVPADQFKYNRYILDLPGSQLKNTAGQERNVSGMAGLYRPWGNTRLTATYFHQKSGIFSGAFGIPRANDLAPDGNERDLGLPTMITKHLKVVSNTQIMLKRNWLEFDLGFQQNDRQELAEPHTHGFDFRLPTEESLVLQLRTFTANARYHFRAGEKWKGTAGGSGQHQQNRGSGYEFFLADYDRTTAGAFGHLRYAPGKKWRLHFGARGDAQRLDVAPHAQPQFARDGAVIGYDTLVYDWQKEFSNASGAAGVSFIASPEWNFKLNAATNFRFPSPAELATDGVHHGTFRHEQGDSSLHIERGVQLDFNATRQSEKWLIQFTPFVNWFQNYLFLSPSAKFSPRPEAGQLYRYRQARARNWGAELKVDYHVVKPLHLLLSGELVRNTNAETGLPLPFTPPASLLLEAEYTFEKIGGRVSDLYIAANCELVETQTRVARNEPETPGYSLVNLRAGAEWRFSKRQRLMFFLQVDNLLNRRYLRHLSRYRLLNLPEPGRNFSLTVQWPFSFYPGVKPGKDSAHTE